MRKVSAGFLIICLYCFPFVYFSMRQDYINGSMLGYLVMIAVTFLLSFLGKRFVHYLPVILGNIASAVISLYFVNRYAGNEVWDGYFKPLSPGQLVILVSVLDLVPQFIAINLANRRGRAEK